MVLTQKIEYEGKVILVLEGNDAGKTVEQIVAEAIVHGVDAAGSMSAWALHFCSIHHPFSTMQRLREMAALFSKWWLDQLDPATYKRGQDDYAYRFDKAQCRYFFSPHFVAWLRREYISADPEPANVPVD